MSPAEELLANVILMDSSRNEIMLPKIDISSPLAKFLDDKHLPYEKKPKIESAKFSVGGLRGMIIIQVIDEVDTKGRNNNIILSRSYIISVTKVRPKEKLQPAQFSIKRRRNKDGKKVNKFISYSLASDGETINEVQAFARY